MSKATTKSQENLCETSSSNSASSSTGVSNSARQDQLCTPRLLKPDKEIEAVEYNNKKYGSEELTYINSICSADSFGAIVQADADFVQNVASFQQKNALGVDGKVGRKTMALLHSISPPQSSEEEAVQIWFLETGRIMLYYLLKNSQIRNTPALMVDEEQCNGDAHTESRNEVKSRRKILNTSDRLTDEQIGYILDYQEIFGLTPTGTLDLALKAHIEIMYDKMAFNHGYTESDLYRDNRKGAKEAKATADQLAGSKSELANRANTEYAANVPEFKAYFTTKSIGEPNIATFTEKDVQAVLDLQVELQIPVSGLPDDNTRTYLRQLTATDIADPQSNIKGDTANDDVKVQDYKKKRLAGSLFVNGISPTDVGQGALGDCWYLAALASVARTNPFAIQNMFIEHSDGTFTVQLYASQEKGGGRSAYKIDTDMWMNQYDNPAFAGYGDRDKQNRTAFGRELWVMLAEKALVLHVSQYQDNPPSNPSYKDIEGGFASIGLEMITGQATHNHMMEDQSEDEIWRTITESLSNGHDLVGSTGGKEPEPPEVPNSLRFTANGLPEISKYLRDWSSIWHHPENIPAAQAEYQTLLDAEFERLEESYMVSYFIDPYKRALKDFEKQLPSFFSAKRDGVVSGHAWTILDAFVAGEERYVKIYNPWRDTNNSTASFNDGAFVLTLSQFKERYRHFSSTL